MEITAKKATSATKLIIGIILFMASVYFIWLNRKFYSFTPEAFGKYIDVKWIIIGHIAGVPWRYWQVRPCYGHV